MADKVTKVSVLLQTLSRIPGLGFLAAADHQMRATVDEVDEYGDNVEEVRRNSANVRDAAKSLGDDDD